MKDGVDVTLMVIVGVTDTESERDADAGIENVANEVDVVGDSRSEREADDDALRDCSSDSLPVCSDVRDSEGVLDLLMESSGEVVSDRDCDDSLDKLLVMVVDCDDDGVALWVRVSMSVYV